MARILHYLDTDEFFGTEQHVLTLLRALTAQGERCALVCREGTKFAERAAQMPEVTVFAGPSLPLRAAVQRLQQCVREWHPDLLHAHNGRTSLQCAWVASHSGNRLRAVATQHFVDPAHAHYRGVKRRVANGMHRWTNARLARVIAVSEAARESAITREYLPPNKVITIHNGIETPQGDAERARAALPLPPESRVVVTVARFNEEKGHRHLLAAIPRILQEHPTAHFVWLGTGPDEAALRAEVEQAGLKDNVHLLGYRQDAIDFVAWADLMVLPSLCEPFGLALVEAMMLATPVLSTDCGGPQEIVYPASPGVREEDAVGWLVAPGDAASLANGVRAILRHPDKAQAMGLRGQERACRHFTARGMASRTVEVYLQALEE